jgi:hypothetical protein
LIIAKKRKWVGINGLISDKTVIGMIIEKAKDPAFFRNLDNYT